MRVAKVVRFGPTARVDVGVDLNNLLNTNYATQFNGRISTTPTIRRARAVGAHPPASTPRGSCV